MFSKECENSVIFSRLESVKTEKTIIIINIIGIKVIIETCCDIRKK